MTKENNEFMRNLLNFESVPLLKEGGTLNVIQTPNSPSPIVEKTLSRLLRSGFYAPLELSIEFEKPIEEEMNHDVIDSMGEIFDLFPPTITEMDEKYPHFCYNPECKKQIWYDHAVLQATIKELTVEQFNKLWKLKGIEFYCCKCFTKEDKLNKLKQIENEFMKNENYKNSEM